MPRLDGAVVLVDALFESVPTVASGHVVVAGSPHVQALSTLFRRSMRRCRNSPPHVDYLDARG